MRSAGLAFVVLLGSAPLHAGEAITFNKDIAPLVFERCATCHRPQGAAPFSVLTYASVRQHVSQIAALTRSRIMPPWRAESEYGGFIGQHPLTDAEIDVIQQWFAQGATEGDPHDLPPAPKLTEGWQLGKPDLIVRLPEPYALRADGTDVFRIFVIPLPVDTVRYVTGLEFHPGNDRVVHHANIRTDRTPTSRHLDEDDPAPGYDGLIARTAMYPDGHFLGWTPGQVAPLLPKGLAWRLDPGTDLVVEIHMQPSGKPEDVQPSIGLFFGSDPPERTPIMLRLGRQGIDIPPEEKNYTITDSFVLPVDVEVQAVQPHAHYRAREITGTATSPDGATRTLIHIADWDFRWQHVYRFVTPFSLPKGTRLTMRYTYDNSSDNAANPTRPPQRVVWGQRSRDEMGDLWIQVLTKDDRDLIALDNQFRSKSAAEDVIGYQRMLESEPESVALHDDLAGLYIELGRADDAVAQFEASAKLKPELAATHFNLGLALTLAGRMDDAISQYQQALAIRADYALAHNNLGGILLQIGRPADAFAHLTEAVRIDPVNAQAQNNLGVAFRDRGDEAAAIDHFHRAVLASPNFAPAISNLAWMLATASDDRLRNQDLGLRLAAQAAELTERRDPLALDVLAAAFAAAGEFERAIETARAAWQLAPEGPLKAEIRAREQLYSQHRPYRRARLRK
jgi:tetratricopeptide (TPR) repeat protein